MLNWDGDIVLVIADGAGGLRGGAQAAQMVIDRVSASASRISDRQDDLGLCRLLDEIGRNIQDALGAGETTAIVAVLSEGIITGSSVGDSRAWLLFDEAEYELTSSQSRKPLLGGGGVSTPFCAEIGSGTLVLATDGLWDYVGVEVVRQIALGESLEMAADFLVKSARLPSGALWDDISVVLCRSH